MMRDVTLVEVGTRDGFQPIAPFIPTETKIALMGKLYEAGIRRMEVTSFVNPAAVPQLADAAQILDAARDFPDLDAQVLVPTVRQAERALAAGANHLAFVLSVSEAHNQNNVRRSPAQSVDECRDIVNLLPAGTKLRVNVATAFDCPFLGELDQSETLAIARRLAEIAPEAEIALCDTTGRVSPDRISSLFELVQKECAPSVRWAFHGHDTYGMGAANVWAAWNAGIDVIDSSIAGLGGCPFAPGATGNVATEDVAWMFNNAGIKTGIDITRLVEAADAFAKIPGALIGGRVRDAVAARERADRARAA
ncbi:hydroxymethylglutaryl-CoA lyase [Sphingobium phenoxybenzoativorans]|uniref:hydroxymethylglutaryl-CoA lyase n=1 Tax=Sphingobium phenoxybenzoativorans TaxID=1592790 RepID=UPI0008734C5A|nr:hydroxymethylglutaryl-CoA lyase [Sphingobium phenoxybenzoativorans]